MNRTIRIATFLLPLVMIGPANGAVTTWTVQSSSSSLTISGALSSGSTFLASVSPQGSGSLTASYGGTLQTAQNAPGGSPIDITFLTANLIANNSGNWDPLPTAFPGTAPANYGALISLGFLGGANFAQRNLAADLSGAAVPLSGSPYSPQTFSSSLDFEFTAGTTVARNLSGGILAFDPSDPNIPIAGQGGSFTSNGSITYGPGGDAGIATLTIPVNFTIISFAVGLDTTSSADDIGVYMNYAGSIVATAPTATVPEASSLVLLGLAGSVIGFIGYRRSFSVEV
jgi:hypothetical protein